MKHILEMFKGVLGIIANRWKVLAWSLVAILLALALAFVLWKFQALRIPAAAVALGLSLILLLWLFPKWQVRSVPGLEAKDRFDRENEARKTLSQILGGLILLAGFYFTWQNLKATQESVDATKHNQTKAEEATQENLRLAGEGQITDRFTKAIAQLGDTRLEVRLGGIYALERIAKDSSKDQTTIMEVLTAYVRENASLKKIKEKPRKSRDLPGPDIQAILDVIGRRALASQEAVDQQLNLGSTYLRTATLGGAELNRAVLAGADLSEAYFTGTHLSQADLQYADLSGASFDGTDLTGAELNGANLSGADLTKAVGLTPAQLESAQGNTDTKLPPNLLRPKSWK